VERAAVAEPPGRLAGRARELPAALALWAVALAVAVRSLSDYLHRPLYDRLVDLHVYVTAVAASVHGVSLYAAHSDRGAGFTYPPFAGLAMLPLAFVPEPVTRVAWTGLTVLGAVAFSLVVSRELSRRGTEAPARLLSLVRRRGRADRTSALLWPSLTVLLLASKPLQSNLRFGQVSLFLALAVLLDVVALGGHRAQGVLTGIAAGIKLTPLVFVPYLWLIGRRRAAGIAAACFVAATAAGAAVFPHDSAAFWSDRLWHQSGGLPLAENGNQSIYAVLLRAGVHGAALTTLWIGICAGVAILGLWGARRAWRAGEPLLSLAVAGCAGILVSPISWTHHQIWILLAAAGLLSTGSPAGLALGAVLALPMLLGLPGVSAAGAAGRWLAANHRALLALAAVALPFTASEVRRHTLAMRGRHA
jgi:alpha-1,2-mannosyltransferase